ncbi:MAG TPA: hypothetical protein VH062_00715 [Polyangiaceae bacterium]|jgi:hypothetical protein|nr:hypothetical protein [Polyangiaceae bacterium]
MNRSLAAAFSWLLLSSCAGAQTSGPGNPGSCPNALPLVTIHGAHGVVLPSNTARRDLSLRTKDAEDYWVPSEDDIGELETSLGDAVKSRLAEATKEPPSNERNEDVAALTHIGAHLAEYVRQYAGIVINGQRRVLLNAFPEDTYCYRDQLIAVLDGGAWFWTIQYDVKLHQFLHWGLTSETLHG